MNLSVTVFILISINPVLCLGFVFRGRFQGYDIPPPEGTPLRADVITSYFSQRLDHFDPSNTDVWSQRYYVNLKYFKDTKSKAIFLLIIGEGQSSINWMSTGSCVEFAKKYSALLFQLEHRFYGVSHPFKDLSVENLRFLSSKQALEDTATFINGMNQEYNLTKDAKWIVFGGSYAGSLAGWLRQKFPHLVQGAVSASGPLFAQLDFHEYMQVVGDVVALHSQKCFDTVKTAFARLEELVDRPGVENITALFNLCQDIRKVNTESDIYSFFQSVHEAFTYAVQYYSAGGPSVDDLCGILTNETYGDELHRLAAANKLYYNRGACTDYTYQTKIDDLRVLDITPEGNMRQWYYQTCTEYGWYETTNQKEHIFGTKAPIKFFTKMCTDIFGKEYNTKYLTSQIEYTNAYYGGYDIDVQKVVFVQGSYDPWKEMGLTKATDHESPVIYINGTSHCTVLYPFSERDPPQLIKARAVVEKLIGAWLGVNL